MRDIKTEQMKKNIKIGIKINLLVIFIFMSIQSISQNLSLKDMQNICNSNNWEYVNQYLLNKNWEFYDSEISKDDNEISQITWTLNKTPNSDRAAAWFYLTNFKNAPNYVQYVFFNNDDFSNIKKTVANFGYTLIENKVENNQIVLSYENSNFYITFTSGKKEDVNFYEIDLLKKGSVLDVQNGLKIEYYPDKKTIYQEYTLSDGKLEGNYLSYHQNGKLNVRAFYKNGMQNGSYEEFDSIGNLIVKFFAKDNFPLGEYIKYHYDSVSLTAMEIYNVKDEKKNGKYEYYVIKNEEKNLIEYGFYVNDKKNGKFRMYTSKDTIVTAEYKDDILHGEYKREVVKNYKGTNGGYEDFLFEDCIGYYHEGIKEGEWKYFVMGMLFQSGSYINGKKTGKWEEHWIFPFVKCEGYYVEDMKQGEWVCFSEESSNEGELISKTNYKDNLINGFKEEFCSFRTVNSFVTDTLMSEYIIDGKSQMMPEAYTKMVIRNMPYKEYSLTNFNNGIMDGDFIRKDSTGLVISKGRYKDGLKDGYWVENAIYELRDDNYYLKDTYWEDDTAKLATCIEEGQYLLGNKTGIWDAYLINANRKYTFEYKEGLMDGDYVRWLDRDNNKILEKRKYVKDDIIQFEIYDTINNTVLYSVDFSNIKESDFGFRKNVYYKDYYISQYFKIKSSPNRKYTIAKTVKIDDVYNSDSIIIKDGRYGKFTIDNKPIIIGEYSNNNKTGKWTYFDYLNNIKYVQLYVENQVVEEKFLDFNDNDYSGKYELIGFVENQKEVIKIKKGVRNGKSVCSYISTDEIISIDYYKNGMKQKK